MKYIFIISAILLVLTSSNKEKKEVNTLLNDRAICEIKCAMRNLPCLSVVEKIVYNGNTENSQILSKETFLVCLKYAEEYHPT